MSDCRPEHIDTEHLKRGGLIQMRTRCENCDEEAKRGFSGGVQKWIHEHTGWELQWVPPEGQPTPGREEYERTQDGIAGSRQGGGET